MSKKRISYSRQLPSKMYTFFSSYSEGGAPSFGKFAKSIGATLEEITAFRGHREFDRAWRECSEIRRDYLIDNALNKRLDSSLVKFLLCAEYGMKDSKEDTSDNRLDVTVEIVGDEA